jgi:hypothetical protein
VVEWNFWGGGRMEQEFCEFQFVRTNPNVFPCSFHSMIAGAISAFIASVFWYPSSPPSATIQTLDEIVSDYIREYRAVARAEMETFRSERTRAAAIRRAALCEFPDGERHPHQYLIPKRLLELAEVRLQARRKDRRKSKPEDSPTFHVKY